jgi:hypothetical protein
MRTGKLKHNGTASWQRFEFANRKYTSQRCLPALGFTDRDSECIAGYESICFGDGVEKSMMQGHNNINIKRLKNTEIY